MPRYRFGEFVLSPRQRVLARRGREVPLIPRYFDLLLFLIEHRGEAVHRRDIFDRVWTDVVVSDSALSQAIRTLRRTLGDDHRDPAYIRTVARHGYRFIGDVADEPDDGRLSSADLMATDKPGNTDPQGTEQGHGDPFEPLLQRLTTAPDEEERRDAAEQLHALGTSEALSRLGVRPGHARGRALLRDTRWDVAGSGAVPLLNQPGAIPASVSLIRLRLQRTARVAAGRVTHAAGAAALAGCIAGSIGGLALLAAPGNTATPAVAVVLAFVGATCGAIGGAGVAAGLSAAETAARSNRSAWLVLAAGAGGGAVGAATQWLAGSILLALVGLRVPVGGGIEGVTIGSAVGLGYALSTRRAAGGLATPRGRDRVRTVLATGLASAVAALVLTWSGRALVGGTIHAIANASAGSEAVLTPLGRLIGDPGFGAVTRAAIGTGEGLLFGIGVALGLTRRPS